MMLATTVIGALVGFALSRIDEQPPTVITIGGALAGLFLGALIALCEEFLVPRWTRRFSFIRLTLSRVAFHTTSIALVLLFVNVTRLSLFLDYTPLSATRYFILSSGLRDFIVGLVAAGGVTVSFQLRRLHTTTEIWHLVSGRYHYPVEEERVILFADLAGSTGLAETLGPVSYSYFIRDLFADISEAIIAWGGTVYQYMGDGVIVTWSRSKGLTGDACVRCFLEMESSLTSKGSHYLSEYDAEPRLRGGIHMGRVVATRVGETKSELAFHGDPLNVAARLQSLCSSYNAGLLISDSIHSATKRAGDFGFTTVGRIEIRGRGQGMEVFAITSPVVVQRTQ
jgi:adenylate cyclase